MTQHVQAGGRRTARFPPGSPASACTASRHAVHPPACQPIHTLHELLHRPRIMAFLAIRATPSGWFLKPRLADSVPGPWIFAAPAGSAASPMHLPAPSPGAPFHSPELMTARF